MNTNSPALQFVTQAWNSIPRGSWRRLNASMYNALRLAVKSGMRFDKDDIKTIAESMRLGYWIGENGADNLYTAACGGVRGADNPSAVAALESYLGRKPYLWAEETKTAKRLYVSRQFNWKGHLVTITSFSRDQSYLTACTYTEIERRFTITLKELTSARKAFDARRKAYEKELSEATTLESLMSIEVRFAADGRAAFRHFDIEIIRAAYAKANERIRGKMSQQEQESAERVDLDRWMSGEDVRRHFTAVRLRVRGGFVETSTMQRATVAGVRRAIAWAAPHRAGWKENGERYNLDHYSVKSITPEGVQVGCTFVPWTEIDRIASQLGGDL